jgi:two-component system, cell cycle sensor histidine kinase and response regulator CckA
VPEPEPTEPINILFVDDERPLRLVAERLLKRLGYEARIVESSPEALSLIRAHPNFFRALITDQNMPEMLGLELAAEIRKTNPTIPIILVTGFADDANIADARALGITEVIGKPYSAEVLSSALRRVLQR